MLADNGHNIFELSRLTGNKRYTDKMTFTFSNHGTSSCAIEACSESQVFSIADFSTNYCNLRNLYCGAEDGCQVVRYDFTTEETNINPSFGAGVDKSACIVAGGTPSMFSKHWATTTDF